MKKLFATLLLCTGLSLCISPPSVAADLVVGARTELAMDPHFQWLDTNTAYYNHIYSALTKINETSQIGSDLAESWETPSDNEWRFKLRQGVKFHDGQPLTAKDVVASIKRALTLPNATSPYTGAVSSIADVSAPDDLTVVVKTTRRDPALLFGLGYISVIPASLAHATTDSFNTGASVVGSGPYKFVSYRAGDRLVLERSPNYFGATPKWDRVTFRFIADDAARVAALLGGNVDLIDFVPPRLIERLKSAPNVTVHTGVSDRPIYLIMDTERDESPFVHAKDGSKLGKNPLKDRRVREALTIAIDRELLTKRVMEGAAEPTSQPVAPHYGYSNPAIPMPVFNVENAKKLLADAGYPDGFSLSLHCTNDRYVNDEKVCQALGQMLSRIGLRVDVLTLPRAVFFPVATDHKPGGRYSLLLLGYASSGDGGFFPNALHSYSAETKLGTWNLGHYANVDVDKAIERGLAAADMKGRYAGFAEAIKLAMEDRALIPLYTQSVVVATRKDLSYATWANERTIADSASQK
jgi:peptide/nickel transport system substrate-binding protein